VKKRGELLPDRGVDGRRWALGVSPVGSETSRGTGYLAMLVCAGLFAVGSMACSGYIPCDAQSPAYADCEDMRRSVRQAEDQLTSATETALRGWAEQLWSALTAEMLRVASELGRAAADEGERKVDQLVKDFRTQVGDLFGQSPNRSFAKGEGDRGGAGDNSKAPLRVAVLLPGIGTSSATEFAGDRSESLGQVYGLLTSAKGYSDVIFFSYNCGTATPGSSKPRWSPAPYEHTDTFRGLGASAKKLECVIRSYSEAAHTPVTFDLVGHSLGGAVAFRYLVNWGSSVEHLVTLDSPVNGANPYTISLWDEIEQKYGLLGHVPWLGGRIDRLIKMFHSEAAGELKRLGKDPVRAGTDNFSLVQKLRQRGITVWTYVNPRDLIVPPVDAGITGFRREFPRGANLDRIIFSFDLTWFSAADTNHGLVTHVLDDDPIARSERLALCHDLEIECVP